MSTVKVPAIYENGVFRPLQPVDVDDQVVVQLTIEPSVPPKTAEILERLRRAVGPDAWPPPLAERLARPRPLAEETAGLFHLDSEEDMRRIAEDIEFSLLEGRDA